MSKYLSGIFAFDEPPCLCQTTKPWVWGVLINKAQGIVVGAYIQCPECKTDVSVPWKEFECNVKFKHPKRYDLVDNCKIIPFRKK